MPKLIINNPDGTAVKYGLNGRNFTVGRAENNDIVLPGGTSSNHHAVLKQSDSGDFIITDLDSTNHTKVNGRIVQTSLLHHGAVLEFGDIVGTYESEFSPMEDVATQVYEIPPTVPTQAPVYQEPVRPAVQPQGARRAAPAVHRPAPAAAASSSGGGCFAMFLVLMVAAFAFAGGVWARHSKEHAGQSAISWVKSIMADRQIAQAEAAKQAGF